MFVKIYPSIGTKNVNNSYGLYKLRRAVDFKNLDAESEAVHQWVYFRIRDVFHPSIEEALNNITPDLVIRGRILTFTDTGEISQEYAVIEVEGLAHRVIVQVSKLLNE